MYAVDFAIKHITRHLRGSDPMDARLSAHMQGVAEGCLEKWGIAKLLHGEAMALVGNKMMK